MRILKIDVKDDYYKSHLNGIHLGRRVMVEGLRVQPLGRRGKPLGREGPALGKGGKAGRFV